MEDYYPIVLQGYSGAPGHSTISSLVSSLGSIIVGKEISLSNILKE